MDQEPNQLREDMERQRSSITDTVNQIENRVAPGRVLARRTDEARNRLTDWKDSVFGNDEPDYRPRSNRYGQTTDYNRGDYNDDGSATTDRIGDAASSAGQSVQQAPQMLRRQTRGNPMAAGVIALGAGWLVGSLLPESQAEKKAARRLEPQLADVAATAKDEGQSLAEDLKEPAQEAAASVKEQGQQAVDEVKSTGKEAATSVKEETSN